MELICAATVDNEKELKTLCECISIIGGKPCVSGKTVCVEFEGPRTTAEKYIELFEQYARHGICSIDELRG